MAVYGATAFVLLQVADLLAQGMGLSDQVLRITTFLVLIGFPIAIVLAWAFDSTPEGMVRTGDAAPGELDALILAPASQRLPAGLMALAGVGLLVAGTWWIARSTVPESSSGDATSAPAAVRLALTDVADNSRPSLAVLPFMNMSSDPEQEYFSDGMTEEILNTLANIRELRVAGRTSAFAYKGENKDLREIGDELGVDYLIEGSVRKAGNSLRITAQLIDAADGSHLWSDQYDRSMEDVFAIQTEIAEAIADALTIPLGLTGDETLVTPTGDLAAYDLYLAGRTKLRERGAAVGEAIQLFEAAIARDSTWAPAWAALAEAREVRVWYLETYDRDIPGDLQVPRFLAESEQAAIRALELDPSSASAIVALGSVHRDRGEWSEAENAYKRALALDPDNAEAYQQYAELLYNIGRVAEAVRFADRALVLDPAPIRFSILYGALRYDGRPEEAAEVALLAMQRDPDAATVATWFQGAEALATRGDGEGAIAAFQKALRGMDWMDVPDTSSWWTEEAFEEWALGWAEGRVPVLPEGFPSFLGESELVRMGRPDSAMVEILSGGGWASLGLKFDPSIWRPELDSLRNDPRVQAAMASLGQDASALRRTPPAERTRPGILESTP